MRLSQLESYLAVVDTGSFTAASVRLRVSQPALSRQVAQLERELGVRLLDRVPQGVRPTAAGVALRAHADRVLGLVRDTSDLVQAASMEPFRIQLGLAPGLPRSWLRGCVVAACAAVPGVQVVPVEATTEVQARRLDTHDLDLGLTHRAPVGLFGTLVLEQPLGLATPGAGPMPERESVPFTALDGLRVVSHGPQDTSLHHDQMIFAARQASVEPVLIFRQFAQYAELAVSEADAAGVVLVEPSAARLVPDWRWRPIVDPSVTVGTYLVRDNAAANPVLRFSDALRAAAMEFGA